ncbi:MAG: hypothetical protein J0G96_01490 [Flavobacteriia bacterium]|nr:hypothetical protein [Flavobacteriia bacterium]OJX38587.1 MAG: hypothetical protein BGO87_10785 [Flavobacteriia bacterium 40-80]
MNTKIIKFKSGLVFNILFIIGLTFASCTSGNNEKPEDSAADTLKNEPVSKETPKANPKVVFKVNTINKASNIDEREGDESEVDVIVLIDNEEVDSYNDFGTAAIIEEDLYLSSEISEKHYSFEFKDNKTIVITRSEFGSPELSRFDEEGNPIPLSQWVKTYSKKENGNWVKVSCKGDCSN